MEKIIIDPCSVMTTSCFNFRKINNAIIKMVNDHYFDLQMYANCIFNIDNNKRELSDSNNLLSRIIDTQNKYAVKYEDMPLFAKENMLRLKHLMSKIIKDLKGNIIDAKEYQKYIIQSEFFGSGAASPSILLKTHKQMGLTEYPIIVKLIPLQFSHHYDFMTLKKSAKKKFIKRYIETPSYAIFVKEAWMYCFSKDELTTYTPTFNCISNCCIINGFPIKNMKTLEGMYRSYEINKMRGGTKLPYKKWLNMLLDPQTSDDIKSSIIESNYGCFEMKEIEGTLSDLEYKVGQFNLSLIFEYLYTKVIAAFIGRIIFTDDHFDNVAFVTVAYTRSYKIKCNGCIYNFYMLPGKMIQFIDLERYVFNFSQYDIYTNAALQNIPSGDFDHCNSHMDKIKLSYKKNNYIFDKSLSLLLNKSFNKECFKDVSEFYIMLNILSSNFVYDIKTFCQVMEVNLPASYLEPPSFGEIKEYYINLDDESLRIIDAKQIYDQIN